MSNSLARVDLPAISIPEGRNRLESHITLVEELINMIDIASTNIDLLTRNTRPRDPLVSPLWAELAGNLVALTESWIRPLSSELEQFPSREPAISDTEPLDKIEKRARYASALEILNERFEALDIGLKEWRDCYPVGTPDHTIESG